MHHHRQGSGSPIVLIHGIGSRWQVWKPVLDRLAAWHDVIALDLPGFGGTPFDGVPGSVPHLADRVAAFLGSLGVERAAVGGSSLGGGVALELARRGLARSVVAFSPVGFFGSAEAAWCRTVVGGARAAGTALGPALPRLFARRAGRVALCGVFFGRPGALPPDECLADARAMITAPGFTGARRTLGEWRLAEPITGVPVTIAWGDRDLVLPYRQAKQARRILPQARHVRLPGCGHLPFADDPRTCGRLLLEAA
ncbi:pimeloyl-ACP methyl ester carboxylesterase [Actinoplanes tereljensis]|uniref:Hydrolase n=1 Tax=Paractinoplanes tereljensis TaxID=571912 RepID=A0A919NKI9_9ACTN|nr:alpha/beta fold hydrolase [Actinoplanes tereljensis]GIF20183.1 hydrolase [Actinoplanes tereljensis]